MVSVKSSLVYTCDLELRELSWGSLQKRSLSLSSTLSIGDRISHVPVAAASGQSPKMISCPVGN